MSEVNGIIPTVYTYTTDPRGAVMNTLMQKPRSEQNTNFALASPPFPCQTKTDHSGGPVRNNSINPTSPTSLISHSSSASPPRTPLQSLPLQRAPRSPHRPSNTQPAAARIQSNRQPAAAYSPPTPIFTQKTPHSQPAAPHSPKPLHAPQHPPRKKSTYGTPTPSPRRLCACVLCGLIPLVPSRTTQAAPGDLSILIGRQPQDLQTTTTELGHLAGALEIHISPDNAHLATPTNAGYMSPADLANYDEKSAEAQHLAPLRMIYDGKPGLASAEFTTALFSPDSQHLAYAMKSLNTWQILEDTKPLVTDAQDIPGLRGRGSPIVFSADSQHVATLHQKEWHWHVIVDGKEWPIPGGINLPSCGLMSFSPDARHLLIVGQGGHATMQIFQDGIPLPPPQELPPQSQPPAPSPQTPPRLLERIFPWYQWAPDSSCIAYYAAFPEKRWQVFTTEANPFESPQYDGILQHSLLFSSDTKQLAFVAKTKNKWHAVINATEFPTPFDEVNPDTIAFLLPQETETTKAEKLLFIARRGAALGISTSITTPSAIPSTASSPNPSSSPPTAATSPSPSPETTKPSSSATANPPAASTPSVPAPSPSPPTPTTSPTASATKCAGMPPSTKKSDPPISPPSASAPSPSPPTPPPSPFRRNSTPA